MSHGPCQVTGALTGLLRVSRLLKSDWFVVSIGFFDVCLFVGCVCVYVVYVYMVHASKYPAVVTCAQTYEGQSRMPETFSHFLTYCLKTGHKLAISVCLAYEIL